MNPSCDELLTLRINRYLDTVALAGLLCEYLHVKWPLRTGSWRYFVTRVSHTSQIQPSDLTRASWWTPVGAGQRPVCPSVKLLSLQSVGLVSCGSQTVSPAAWIGLPLDLPGSGPPAQLSVWLLSASHSDLKNVLIVLEHFHIF